MSDSLKRVRSLAAQGKVGISYHGYDELADDAIFAVDALAGLADAVVIEDYPLAAKGPSVLVLQTQRWPPDSRGLGHPERSQRTSHVGNSVRPDPARWSQDFTRRKR